MPYTVSAAHIAPKGGGFEPQRKNNFTISLPVGGTVLTQALESCPLPVAENEVIRIKFGNEERKVAGPATFNDISVQIKDFIDSPVIQQLMAWRNRVYEPSTGVIHLAKYYKENGSIVMFGPDGTLPRTWTVEGVWPSKVDAGGGDMSSGNNNMITVTLQIDRAYMGSGGTAR